MVVELGDPEWDRQGVVDYMAGQAPNEVVTHLEKVTTERVIGRDRAVWDVQTTKGRWWVITEPMNLYAQDRFPSMDVALSFHVGLSARVEERELRVAPADAHVARYGEAWRKWEQAAQALNEADEAEEFQAIGMRCRESLIAFVRTASEQVELPSEVTRPKAGDVVAWSEVIGNAVAPGASNARHRGYLKAVAKATWELASWLTHSASASAYDAYAAVRATENALMSWSLAIMASTREGPPRCPVCRSYRLRVDYRSGEGFGAWEIVICEVCSWEGNKSFIRHDESAASSAEEAPSGDCIAVEVPLTGSPAPKPRRELRLPDRPDPRPDSMDE
jgi:hypothetical protein